MPKVEENKLSSYPKTLHATVRIDARFLASVLSIFVSQEVSIPLSKSNLLQFALEYTAGNFISQGKAIPFSDTEKAVRFLESNGINTRDKSTFYALKNQILKEDREEGEVKKEVQNLRDQTPLSKEEVQKLRSKISG